MSDGLRYVRASAVATGATEARLAAGSGRLLHFARAILFGLLGPGAGLALIVLAFLREIFGSFVSGPLSRGEWRFVTIAAAAMATAGVVYSISIMLAWRKPSLTLSDGSVTLSYPAFARPLVIPAGSVSMVFLDERKRAIEMPAGSRLGRAIPLATAEAEAGAFPNAPWGAGNPPPALPAGEAEVGPRALTPKGSTPFLRVNPEDVPNVALVLRAPVELPRIRVTVAISPGTTWLNTSRGPVWGLLLRVAEPATVASWFPGNSASLEAREPAI